MQMGVFAACSDVALLGADAVHPGSDTTEAQVHPWAHTTHIHSHAFLNTVRQCPRKDMPLDHDSRAARYVEPSGPPPCVVQVVNKVGSLPLSLCCRHAGVPVVAVTSSLKVSPWPAGPALEGEEKGPDELTTTATGLQALPQGPGGVRVRNVYFEGVPLALVDALVVEDGPLDQDGVRRLADKRRLAYETAFFGAR